MSQKNSPSGPIAQAYTKTDMRFRVRKERTALISFRLKPEVRVELERMARAEGVPMVEIVERGIHLLNKASRKRDMISRKCD